MRLFFDCVRFAATRLPKSTDDGLLTDRLYRRYVRFEDLEPTITQVELARDILTGMPTKTVDWKGFRPEQSELNRSLPNLGALFDRYIRGALEVISDARGFQKAFNAYKPVITITTSGPDFFVEKQRPLADYDALEGEPMWLR